MVGYGKCKYGLTPDRRSLEQSTTACRLRIVCSMLSLAAFLPSCRQGKWSQFIIRASWMFLVLVGNLAMNRADLFLVCIELVDVTLDVWVPYGGGIIQYVTDERVVLMFVYVTQPTST